jgi:uncharacterized protein YndB with AHSA1/START domain
MLRHTRKTSPGPPRVGTTYVEETRQGAAAGEIVELEAPRTLVFHWWERSRSGRLRIEGWPGYHLEPAGEDETVVRHRATLVPYGVLRLGTPVWRRLAIKERSITVNALKASFDRSTPR